MYCFPITPVDGLSTCWFNVPNTNGYKIQRYNGTCWQNKMNISFIFFSTPRGHSQYLLDAFIQHYKLLTWNNCKKNIFQDWKMFISSPHNLLWNYTNCQSLDLVFINLITKSISVLVYVSVTSLTSLLKKYCHKIQQHRLRHHRCLP